MSEIFDWVGGIFSWVGVGVGVGVGRKGGNRGGGLRLERGVIYRLARYAGR